MTNSISNTVSNTHFNAIATKKAVDHFQGAVGNPEIAPIQNEKKASSTATSEQEVLPAEKAKKITNSLNQLLETTSTKLRYQYHEKLDKYYVVLMDSKTDEVVREIPNKKLMDIYAAMLDFVGVFIDEKI